MTLDEMRVWYRPPTFRLYEFDDARLGADLRADATRWLAGFNGRIGDAAENVDLSWRARSGA